MDKHRLTFVRILAVLVAIVLVQHGWPKLFEEGLWTGAFDEWGYPPWFRVLIGLLEIGGSLALLVPWTAFGGAVVLVGVMFGAAGTLLLNGRLEGAATPLTYGVLALWIALEQHGWVADRRGPG